MLNESSPLSRKQFVPKLGPNPYISNIFNYIENMLTLTLSEWIRKSLEDKILTPTLSGVNFRFLTLFFSFFVLT